MLLTETHKLCKHQNKEVYNIVYSLLQASKNLYNKANFYIRQAMIIGKKLKEDTKLSDFESNILNEINALIEKGNARKLARVKGRKEPKTFKSVSKDSYFLNYYMLDSMLFESEEYRDLPVHSSQQILRQLNTNWNSFFSSNKRYKSNKTGYIGRPRFPKYIKGNINQLILTNLQCKIVNNKIKFPKLFKGFTLSTKADNIRHIRVLKEIDNSIRIEVVYEVKEKELKEDNNRYLGIDLGLNNLTAIVNNIGITPILINGRGLKSINQFYNKELAEYKSVLDKSNVGIKISNRIRKLTMKRNNKIKDKMHKISRYIIDYAVENNISKIVIGKNDGWKQELQLGDRVNQNFIGIPFEMLINQIKYKGILSGIEVIETEESYTSGTSYIDNELPIKECYNKSRRIKRGLFKSNKGILINADINGACQILKKVYNMTSKGYQVMLRPKLVSI